jgi:eukaryotic-like serine/threonine-protein kinase
MSPGVLRPLRQDADVRAVASGSPQVSDHEERLRAALAGRYAVLHRIGSGATAAVYLADDLAHQRRVAIKLLLPEIAVALGPDRFLREIAIESRLDHRNIVPIYDSGTAGSLFYAVMPYIEGESLRDRIRRERQLSLEDTIAIAGQVAEALDYAHSQDVVHRDIKPANILLAGSRVLVVDFGLARAISAAGSDELTASGLVVGTAEYMSPEQGSGDSQIDGRTDLYSLGCVVYEMLAGEPPYTGKTRQIVIGRHLSEDPPSLVSRRASLPAHADAAVRRALAKSPADRFRTTGKFIEALKDPAIMAGWEPGRPRLAKRIAPVAVTLAVLALLAGLWKLFTPAPVPDPNRVVVFPLRDGAGGATSSATGEDVATYIGYVLAGSEPLQWVEGRDLFEAGRGGKLSASEARKLSRAKRARYYIDGSIVRAQDSVTVVLRLNDVTQEIPLKLSGRSGSPGASEARLGALAVGDLLPSLLDSARAARLDAGELRRRPPAAIANFLQGERAYRRMQFGDALAHYRRALAEDSAFAWAALKGAEAANWVDQAPEDAELADIAVRNMALLPARVAPFATGLRDYFAGRADSAVAHFRELIAADSSWTEAWTALGEVYFHLLPDEGPPDSLAEAAFLRARRSDPDFTPPTLHLFDLALRRGDAARAGELEREVERAGADTQYVEKRRLILRCLKGGLAPADWAREAQVRIDPVLAAGTQLALSTVPQRCAEDALGAVLEADSAGAAERYAALFVLQSLYFSSGRSRDVPSLMSSSGASGLPIAFLYLLDAVAGVGFGTEARDSGIARGEDYRRMAASTLWLLGSWEAEQGNQAPLARIATALDAKLDSTRSRRDSLFVQAIAAQTARVSHDTGTAIQRFQALVPFGSRRDLTWLPFASLGGERMTLARLLTAQGRGAEAEQTLGLLDAPEPVSYLLYRRQSLELRAQLAEQLGQNGRAAEYRRRLAAMQWKESAVRPNAASH